MSLLTEKREAAGLSMTECAKRAGMDLSKLSRLEHGHLKLKVDDLRTLARVIGCDVRELILPEDVDANNHDAAEAETAQCCSSLQVAEEGHQ